jgi:single-strand DNA-binding protein
MSQEGCKNNPVTGENKMSNNITVVGNVGQQPELRVTPSNMAVLEFTVASTTGKDEKKKTTWFTVVAFGKTAENAAASLNKGDTVIVVGRMETDEYKKKDGTQGKFTKVVADDIGCSVRWDVWLKDRSQQTMNQVAAKVGRTLTDEEPF